MSGRTKANTSDLIRMKVSLSLFLLLTPPRLPLPLSCPPSSLPSCFHRLTKVKSQAAELVPSP